jgi:hypothetical protein
VSHNTVLILVDCLIAQHMEAALDSVDDVDDVCKHKLMLYFRHMAHFLVAGTAFTNCTHLIGNTYYSLLHNALPRPASVALFAAVTIAPINLTQDICASSSLSTR